MANPKVTRRHFLQTAAGMAGVAALAACVPAAPAPAGEAGGAAAPAAETKRLWVLQKQDYHPDYNDFIRAHIERFAQDNGYELDVAYTSGFGGTGADLQKLAAGVQAGDPPDAWMDNRVADQLNQLGAVQVVTDLQQEATDKYGDIMPRPKKETFLDGDFYGVTLHTRSDGGWARKDVFDAANIDIVSLRTYDELRDAALAVSDRPTRCGAGASPSTAAVTAPGLSRVPSKVGAALGWTRPANM